MGGYIWKVKWIPVGDAGEAGTMPTAEEGEARASLESIRAQGRPATLYRKEEVGDDDGLMAMSNPDAYGWVEIE